MTCSDIPKHLLKSARVKYLYEIGDLLSQNDFNKAFDRINEMPDMQEDWRPE